MSHTFKVNLMKLLGKLINFFTLHVSCLNNSYTKTQILWFCGATWKWRKIWEALFLWAFDWNHTKVHKIAENMKWWNIKLEFTVGTSVTLISTSVLPSHLKVNSLQYAILKVFSCFYCQLTCQICNICL
jgi:hypothetical protein